MYLDSVIWFSIIFAISVWHISVYYWLFPFGDITFAAFHPIPARGAAPSVQSISAAAVLWQFPSSWGAVP